MRRWSSLLPVMLGVGILVAVLIGVRLLPSILKTNLALLCVNKTLAADTFLTEPGKCGRWLGAAFLDLDLDHLDEQLLQVHSDIQYSLGNEELAGELWQKAGADLCVWTARGNWYLDNSRPGQAEVWFNRAAQGRPDAADGWYGLGLAYKQQQIFDQAAKAFNTATAYPMRCGLLGRSDALVELGGVYLWYLQPTEPDLALAAYSQALDLDDFGESEHRKIALSRAADLFMEQGQFSTAEEYLRELVSWLPQDAWAHLVLGETLFRRGAEQDIVLEHLQLASELDPDNPSPFVWIGEVYLARGELQLAIDYYQRAHELAPNNERIKQKLTNLLSTVD